MARRHCATLGCVPRAGAPQAGVVLRADVTLARRVSPSSCISGSLVGDVMAGASLRWRDDLCLGLL